jgi:uncharacterized protein GlcG (DUF336 family)
MNKAIIKTLAVSFVVGAMCATTSAQAACSDFARADIKSALINVVSANSSGGFNLPMWLTFVDESGTVCSVSTSGGLGAGVSNDKWLGSRVISAQKANTANAFSLNAVSISTGALYAAVQPGGSLFGLQESNPIDAAAAYAGTASTFGAWNDPLNGKRIGGVNVFGGGLAVYKGGVKVGAIGVSGDTSCTDHAVAWQVRDLIGGGDTSPGGFEKLKLTSTFAALGDHPSCGSDGVQAGNASLGYQ